MRPGCVQTMLAAQWPTMCTSAMMKVYEEDDEAENDPGAQALEGSPQFVHLAFLFGSLLQFFMKTCVRSTPLGCARHRT